MAKQTFTTGQVLTAAQMTSLQQTAMGGGSATAKTASYTLVAADAGTVIQMNSASATTITVNTALFAAGDSVQIQNIGAGVCTVTAGTATVTTAGSLALSQWEGGQLYFSSTSASIFFDLVQSSAAPAANYSLLNSGGTALSGTTLTVSGISGQNELMILVVGASTGSTNSSLTIRFNTDSGNNYSRITNQQEITGTYDSTFFIPSTSTASAGIIAAQMDNDATSTMSVQMKVDGCNSAGLKPYQYSGGGSVISATAGSGPVWYSGGGLYAGTSTISSVSFVSAGTFDAGTVYIYGSA